MGREGAERGFVSLFTSGLLITGEKLRPRPTGNVVSLNAENTTRAPGGATGFAGAQAGRMTLRNVGVMATSVPLNSWGQGTSTGWQLMRLLNH